MDEGSLVRKFLDADMQLTEDALQKLRGRGDTEAAANTVLSALKGAESKPFVITADVVIDILDGTGYKPEQITPPQAVQRQEIEEPIIEKRLGELAHVKFKPLASEYEDRVEVLEDVTGRSYSEGELKDFVALFRDRYERLGSIMRKRVDMHDAVPIASLRNFPDRQLVKVVGMVKDRRESSAGNMVIEMEDMSGSVLALVFSSNKELLQNAGEVVNDEVIGVVASLRNDGRSPRLFVKDIIWPDLPVRREINLADDPVCAALISDLHVGSTMFFEDVFLKFVKWLRGESDGSGEDLAGRVKYLVIAGDVVDGIGVYPNQEEELLINDIFKQYDAAAKLLAEVPDYIKIVIAPGNHDAVRPSEPQPAIHKEVASGLYDLNSMMVGNPSRLSLHGVEFLVYHGRSFDDIISNVPGLSRQKTGPPMVKLLKKRHLAPMYGGRTAISPENRDYMVIEKIPDVFHCGHLHVWGYERYRDVSLINSGTFQGMTDFMRQLGVKPTPGIVPIVDLKTHNTVVKSFA